MKNVTKEYSIGEIVVKWDSAKCIHAGMCFRNAGKVFKPKERPWIQMENDNSKSIADAIDKCLSGALSYRKIDSK